MKNLWLLSALLFASCNPCGEYDVTTGHLFNDESVDGHYREKCGPNYGTWGSWNLFEDDMVEIRYEPWGEAAVIGMFAVIPIERFVVGEVISTPDLTGWAELADMASALTKTDPLVLT